MRAPSRTVRSLFVVLAGLALGCGDGKAPVKTYTIAKPTDPLEEVRALLTRYADGQPVGSEVTTYEGLVAQVREQDGDRADVLDEGLKAIAANPRSAAAQARRLLDKLGAAPSVPRG